MSTAQALPYHLPKTPKDQLRLLAKILAITQSQVGLDTDAEIEAMAVTILYRHLDRIQKQQALANILGLKNQILASKLYSKVVDISVNPQWGVWSLSNDELLSDQAFHTKFNEIAGYVGISASITSAKELIQEAWKNKRLGKGGWITLAIWGCVIFNNLSLIHI